MLLFLVFCAVSCWRYRRSVEIDNPDVTARLNEDVLVIVDTMNLILEGKLSFNCSDVEFAVDKLLQIYPHYLESSCNSETTYFWINFESLPPGKTILFVYYGRDIFHRNGEAVFMDGNYVAPFATLGCPADWSDYSMMSDSFLRAGKFSGIPGGDEEHFHTEHGHSGPNLPSDPAYIAWGRGQEVDSPYITAARFGHVHEFYAESNIENSLPPYYSLQYCFSDSPTFPIEHVGIYNILGDIPSDYEDIPTMDDLLTCNGCDGAAPGVSGGSEFHSHTVDVTLYAACDSRNPECYYIISTDNPSREHSVDDHKHANGVGELSTEYEGYPPSKYVLFKRRFQIVDQLLQSHENMIVLTEGQPPMGWLAWNGADGLLLRSTPVGTPGLLGVETGEDFHTHNFSYSVPRSFRLVVSQNPTGGGPREEAVEADHTHSVEGPLDPSSNFPRYFELELFKRKLSLDPFIGEEEWMCYGYGENDTEVCSGHGICSGPNICNCTDDYFGEACHSWKCGEYLQTDPDVCSRHGVCIGNDQCDCGTSGYFGFECEDWNCGVIHYNDTGVCGGQGDCYKPDSCHCSTDFYGPRCADYYCDGIKWTDKDVCDGSGNCTAPDTCVCFKGYYEDDCTMWNCTNYPKTHHLACSMRGDCIKPDNCDCYSPYFGTNCERFMCDSIPMDSIDACNRHGECIDIDDCKCEYGYQGTFCGDWDCNGINKDDITTCRGNGTCIDFDLCDCTPPYEGDDCEIWECDDLPWFDTGVCSDRGMCIGPENCVCLQDDCPEDLERACVFGPTCAEVITYGFWMRPKNIIIDYVYADVLTDELLFLHEEEKSRAYFLCSDLLEKPSIMGGSNDEKSCFFDVVNGVATRLHINIDEDKHGVKHRSKLGLNLLSERGTIVEVEILKKFNDVRFVSPASVAVGFIFTGILLILFIAVLIAVVVLLVVYFRGKMMGGGVKKEDVTIETEVVGEKKEVVKEEEVVQKVDDVKEGQDVEMVEKEKKDETESDEATDDSKSEDKE